MFPPAVRATEIPLASTLANAAAPGSDPTRKSLSTRLILIVVPLVLLTGFLATGIMGGIKAREAAADQVAQGEVLGRSYAALLRDYIVDMETSHLATILQTVASNHPVVCASIAAPDMVMRYGWPVLDCANYDGAGPAVSVPILDGRQQIAILTLRLDSAPAGASLWTAAAPSIIAVASTLLVLALALAVLLRHQVAQPIRRLTEAMRVLSAGRTDFIIPGDRRHDEIGDMARALAVFRDTKIEADRVGAVLVEAQAELIESSKLAFLGSMVAGVAHEVNTPIGICVTAMSTADDMVQEVEQTLKARQLTEDGLHDFFESIRTSSTLVLTNLDRAATLIRSFKGIATDQTSETPRRLELGAYLREILASLRPELKRSAVEVQVVCETPIEIAVLPGPLWQIVSNLVLNGVVHAFSDEQGGTITLTVSAEPRGWVRIICADTGKGMAPEIRERIFEPFFTTRRGQGGTGLGLFITYNLVTQALGGRIRCDSEPGQGTQFDITLPPVPPASDAPQTASLPREVHVS
jgi:signal transduction histidine kinase